MWNEITDNTLALPIDCHILLENKVLIVADINRSRVTFSNTLSYRCKQEIIYIF